MRGRGQSIALLVLALLQPVAGRLHQLLHRGASIEERSDAAGGAVTPAKGAFAIWGPLFAGSLALAVRSFHRRHREPCPNHRISWLSGLAFAGNNACGVQAQFAGLGWPSFGVIVAGAAAASAATIEAEAHRDVSCFARFAARAIGPLAGWLTVATFANLEATLNATGHRVSGRAEPQRALGLIGAASAAATGMAVATRGNLGYAAASAWGLGGVALKNRRALRPAVARMAVAGVCAVGLATLWSGRCLRR